jgi:hypothetical protein
MPIRRYVETGVVFTPQALAAMSKALESATEALGNGGDEIKRQALARAIIRFAQQDDDLDAATLHDRAVEAFGVPAAVPQPPATYLKSALGGG